MNTEIIKYKKIPSEFCGYNVWLMYGRSGFMIGTIRRIGRYWNARIQDGREHNKLSGMGRNNFKTRYEASIWIKDAILKGMVD